MFKKEFKIQAQNKLKSSDKRKFRELVARNFSILKDHDTTLLDTLIPPKFDVEVAKIAGSRTVIYLVEENPLFIDLDGRNDFFPTG